MQFYCFELAGSHAQVPRRGLQGEGDRDKVVIYDQAGSPRPRTCKTKSSVSYNAAMSLRVLAASANPSFRLAKATRLRRPCLVRTRIASQPSGPRTSCALNETPQPTAGLREVER